MVILVKLVEVDPIAILKSKLEQAPNIKKIKIISHENNKILISVLMEKEYIIHLLLFSKIFPSKIEKIYNENIYTNSIDYQIIAAPYISPETAETCKKHMLGYIDYSGNCFIAFANIIIVYTGQKNLYPNTDKIKNIFNSSSYITSNILRTLLKDPSAVWKLKHLSEEVGCSIGMVARVKDYLCDQAWASMGANGLSITNPEKLLRAWSNSYHVPEERILNAYTLSPIPEFEKAASDIINSNHFSGCLTAFSGGARYAPVVRYSKAHLWILKDHLADFIKLAELKPVNSGANITVFITEEKDILVDSRIVNGFPVASPVQVYLDLMQQKGRGEEMAEVILMKEICK